MTLWYSITSVQHNATLLWFGLLGFNALLHKCFAEQAQKLFQLHFYAERAKKEKKNFFTALKDEIKASLKKQRTNVV